MDHTEFTNRVQKRFKQVKKWAQKERVSCFRIYHDDLPNYPIILDHYDGDYVIWFKLRKRDETPEQIQNFQRSVVRAFR